MDFFQAQNDARKNTTRLVALFVVAVIALILITNFFVMIFLGMSSGYFGNDFVNGRYVDRVLASGGGSTDILSSAFWEAFLRGFNWQTFVNIGLAVTAVVAAASLYKIMALSAGGKVVAEMLGGRLISQNTEVLLERKVLNVVEEMAIASGLPVPPVYLLPEAGINAFAAGFSPGDAVIGVTEGCLQHLNRDQLQGVIAHEFSHILNGDIRLNIRLMGLLHGILVVGIIGHHILRSVRHARKRRSDSAGATIVLGLGLMAIGSVGSFFGSLIKASVSRQREYLADASAVQFTRNPDGLADALKKIGSFADSSILENSSAPEVSHAFFANGVRSRLASLFATHPPLEERIRRIQPYWNGSFKAGRMQPPEAAASENYFSQAGVPPAAADIAFAMNHIGCPHQQHLEHAHKLIGQIPAELIEAVREPYGARALIYTLVINKDSATRKIQLQHLKEQGDKGVYELTTQLLTTADTLNNQFRLPLIEVSIASMRQLSPAQYRLFKKNLAVLIKADNKVSLFQWSLQRIVFHYLEAEFVRHSIFAATAKYSKLSHLENEIALLLSLLAHAEHKSYHEAKKSFDAGKKQLPELDIKLLPRAKIALNGLDNAIERLTLLKPLLKPRVLKACAACIISNNNISIPEAELLRAFSAAMDCPMPLLVRN